MVAFLCNFVPISTDSRYYLYVQESYPDIVLSFWKQKSPKRSLKKVMRKCAARIIKYVCGYLINRVLFTPVLLHWCIIMHAVSKLKTSKIAWWLILSTLQLSHIYSRRVENLKITCKKFQPNMVSHPTTDNYLSSQGQIGCILCSYLGNMNLDSAL